VEAAGAGRELQKRWGGADAAVVLTAAPEAVQQAFKSLKRNGRLVLVGLATASYELPLTDTVLKGIEIRGSYLGTREDLEEVFALARSSEIRPQVQAHALDDVPNVLEQLRRGEIAGRAVITFA
jgi:propanol-preferring alcohol dehydrogenase